MIIKTKKYELPKTTYMKLGILTLLRQQWYFSPIPFAIMSIGFIFPRYWIWFFVIGLLVGILYIAFWALQFYGVTILPQNKIIFDKMMYEIDSRQILMKINAKEGMPITWDKVTEAKKGKDYYLLFLSKAQFIHLPFKIFNSENDIKFMEALLRRKEYIKGIDK